MGPLHNRLFLLSKWFDQFSTKLCVILLLSSLANYMSDRSYLILPPKPVVGEVIFRPGDKVGTGDILPGKLIRDQDISLTESETDIIVVPPLNLKIGDNTIKDLFEAARVVNSDVVGYVYIPDSKVNYPVLHQPGGNNFYLNNNINKKKDSHGAIYLDDSCETLSDEVKLIHGHSMKNETMFRQILNYKTQSWADSHPFVYIYDGETTRVYEVFSCVVVNASTETVPLGFHSLTDKIDYFNTVLDRSKIAKKEIAELNDLVVLNTCSYEFDNSRALVYGSRVDAIYNEENMIEMGGFS